LQPDVPARVRCVVLVVMIDTVPITPGFCFEYDGSMNPFPGIGEIPRGSFRKTTLFHKISGSPSFSPGQTVTCRGGTCVHQPGYCRCSEGFEAGEILSWFEVNPLLSRHAPKPQPPSPPPPSPSDRPKDAANADRISTFQIGRELNEGVPQSPSGVVLRPRTTRGGSLFQGAWMIRAAI